MGLIGKIIGASDVVREVGTAVGGVAEVFVGNEAEREAAIATRSTRAIEQFGAEFAQGRAGRFDGFVNGLNRLPRPLLALSTFALFGYAMGEPAGFATRMQSLALVPEPLWWLMGAIVSFYFGARELHYQRVRSPLPPIASVLAVARSTIGQSGGGQSEIGQPVVERDTIERDTIERTAVEQPAPERPTTEAFATSPLATIPAAIDPDYNAAVEDWRRQRG